MKSNASNVVEPCPLSPADLARRREELRRGLARSNSAIGIALLVTVGLALAAAFYAEQARQANERIQSELWNAQQARAMALRLSGKVGRRQESLNAIAQAVSLKPTPELRNEAIATLALIDLQPDAFWQSMPARVTSVAFAPDLDLYALGDAAGRVDLCRKDGSPLLPSFTLTNRAVMSLNFSPEGHFLAARFQGGALRVWDTKQASMAFAGNFPQTGFNEHTVLFHPHQSWLLAAANDGIIQFVCTTNWQATTPLQLGGRIAALGFNPEGTQLAVALDTRIEIWDFAARQILQGLEVGGAMTDLDWHPGAQIFAAAHADGNVTLLDRRIGQRMTLRAHTMPVTQVMFDPKGDVLVTTSWDGTSRFWDAGSGKALLTTQAGYASAFDRDGKRIFYYKERLGVGAWNYSPALGYACLAVPVGLSDRILGVDFSPDGAWISGTTTEGVHLWRRDSRQHALFAPLADAQRAAFRRDGRSLVASAGNGLYEIQLPGTNAMSPAPATSPTRLAGADHQAYWLGFTTRGAGQWFAAASSEKVAVVNLENNSPVQMVNWAGPRRSAAVSPDGRYLATSAWKGGGTLIWDLTSRKLAADLKDEGGLARFSSDGQWLAVGASTEFIFYEVDSWKPMRKLGRDVASALSGIIAFSPQQDLLALTHTSRQVRLLSANGGRVLATLDAPHAERITDLCFSPDGLRLAAATDNRVIQYWDLAELRGELQSMGLDWIQKLANDSRAEQNASPNRAYGRLARTTWISGAGAGLALLFALYSIRNHRRLVSAYEALEILAEKRREELAIAHGQLIHSQKMKALGTLAAGVAHDFNNLLSIIRMSNQLLARQVEANQENQEELGAIEVAVSQGKAIVRSILGYSRPGGPPDELFSVAALVTETLGMLSQGFLSGIVLTLELDDGAPEVRGEKSRLEQILLNLVVNAAEAMQSRGKLTLAVREIPTAGPCVLAPKPSPAYVELMVQDSGPGIRPDDLSRIFEPFFSTKKSGGDRGVGLGLTTVYTIAEQDGFGLAVDTQPGTGTTFRIFIPILKTTAAKAEATPTSHGA